MTELTKPDIVTNGLNLILSYWADKPKATGLFQSFLESFENPVDLLFEVLNETSLFDAEGVQLDVIGKLWKVARESRTDADYRDALFERITQNVADSTPEKIIEIIKVATSSLNLNLFEHYPGNIHVDTNVSLIPSIKALGDSITASGVSFNARFDPTHDNVSGTRPTSFEYRNFNLLTGSWTDSNVTYTAATGVAPDGTTTLFTLQDASAVAHGYRYQDIPSFDSSQKYFASCWIEKDAGATHNAMFRVKLSGGTGIEEYDLEVSPVDGSVSITTDTPVKWRVLDLDTRFFLWMEIEAVDLTHTTLTVEVYPAISTTLGTYAVATVGTTEFWTPVVALVDETKHNSDYEVTGTLTLSERLLLEYFLIDEVGDNIITEAAEFMIADSDSRYSGYGSKPLSEYGNTTKAQPLTEVI